MRGSGTLAKETATSSNRQMPKGISSVNIISCAASPFQALSEITMKGQMNMAYSFMKTKLYAEAAFDEEPEIYSHGYAAALLKLEVKKEAAARE